MDWSEEKIIALIEAYRTHPALWDTKLADYKSKDKRNEAWNEIAASMSVDRLEVERKIKVILAQYRRERQKNSKLKKAGLRLDDVRTTTWFAFKSLSFLSDKRKPMEAISEKRNGEMEVLKNQSITDTNISSHPPEVNISRTPDDLPVSQNVCELSKKPEGVSNFPRSKHTVRSVASTNEDKKLEEAYNIMTSVAQKRECRDEYAIFGEQVAFKLKKLDERNRIILQHKINTMIFEAEMDVLQRSHSEITQQTTSLWNPVHSWVSTQSIPIANVIHTYTSSTACTTPTITNTAQSTSAQAPISQINYTTSLNTVQNTQTDTFNF